MIFGLLGEKERRVISSRFLRLVFLLVVLVALNGAAATEQECANTDEECKNPEVATSDDVDDAAVADDGIKEDPSCPSRPHIIQCAAQYLDTNDNNKLEREELEHAIGNLPWYSRGILKIIGSVDKIMKKCDHDHDGAISIDKDMENTKETCLATCFKRRAFKSAFFPECDL